MTDAREAVYCTLLLSDSYLPGAMVLAHSLRDNRTRGKLVALVTLDTLHVSTIDELKTIYDDVISVDRFTNKSPANLFLMDRPDLIAAFTKIELWKQTQYSKIVYLDADVVALRAPDELRALDRDFAAIPDIGWPDCFNTGVMVLKPNLQDYYALLALAQRGISFDGADQGLLNMHFRDWHRLSFTYNCTPSGNYQYLPAYRHFQNTISMVHYIGQQKPWNMERRASSQGGSYGELLGKWWEVYDRHYRPKVGAGVSDNLESRSHAQNITQNIEFTGADYGTPSMTAVQSPGADHTQTYTHTAETPKVEQTPYSETPVAFEHMHTSQHKEGTGNIVTHTSVVPQYVRGEQYVVHPQHVVEFPQGFHSKPADQGKDPGSPGTPQPPMHQQPKPIGTTSSSLGIREPTTESSGPEQGTGSPPQMEWDASRAPPPINSKPEAISLPTQTYSMSRDTKLFKPPESYPEPPKNMYYEVPPVQPVPQKPPPIFPWEEYAPKPTRVFPEESQELEQEPERAPLFPGAGTGSFMAKREDPFSPTRRNPAIDPWDSYSLSNAWDEDPGIERYVEAIQRSRKPKPQVSYDKKPGDQHPASAGESTTQKPSMKITDFPTELERPSLPVTPAPMQRPSFWGQEQEDSPELPAAEGVPKQEDWNPIEKLEELQRRQAEFFGSKP